MKIVEYGVWMKKLWDIALDISYPPRVCRVDTVVTN